MPVKSAPPRNDGKPVTLYDVAQEVGLSTASVSRGLNDPGRLRPTTVARIRDAAERLGYRPNLMAQNLKSGSTRLVYVVIPSLNHFYFEVFGGVERAAAELGYSAIVGHSARDSAREAGFFDQVASGRADGLLLIGAGRIDVPASQRSKTPPAVTVLEGVEGQDFPSVRIDNVLGATQATNHLLALGHRDIAHITGDARVICATRRRAGFLAAMAAAGLPGEENCVPGEFTAEAGAVAMEMLLARSRIPTAVFAANDEVAIGAIGAIRAAGLAVPGDISVIGYGDYQLGRFFHPALTTVHIPAFDLGYQAMIKLGHILTHGHFDHDAFLGTHVVVRETTAPPRQDLEKRASQRRSPAVSA